MQSTSSSVLRLFRLWVLLLVVGVALWTLPQASALGRPKDRDSDGIPDAQDKCPDQPEDLDGDKDDDGCPDDRDTDADGLMDSRDLCPTLPEDKDGDKDDDGCPDAKNDKDEDAIPDDIDKCPFNPEDHDGFQDEDGCPDPDNDADGLSDSLDLCPEQAEDLDGNEDDDGCPEFEAVVTEKKIEITEKIFFEHNSAKILPVSYPVVDSVLAVLVENPDMHIRIEGHTDDEDDDGCPEFEAVVTEKKIEITEKIFFEHNSTKLLPVSYPVVDSVLAVLVENPDMHIRIEGHTDDEGADDFNLKLSDGRAKSVAQYLIARGITQDRLVPIGFGERQPLTENKTEDGRAQNRRVEFFILNR